MGRRAAEGEKPGIGRPIFGARGAVERREGEESRFFLVRFFLGLLGKAEYGAEEARGVAPGIGGRRDLFLGTVLLEFVAGVRRVDSRRKGRQQCEQHQEDLRKAAME